MAGTVRFAACLIFFRICLRPFRWRCVRRIRWWFCPSFSGIGPYGGHGRCRTVGSHSWSASHNNTTCGLPLGYGCRRHPRHPRPAASRSRNWRCISAIGLGAMIAFAVRAPLVIASILVGTFAVFHGHAHGAELPPGTDAAAYSIGFVLATGLLHLSGIALGGLTGHPTGRMAVRAMGALIAAVGVVFLRARV